MNKTTRSNAPALECTIPAPAGNESSCFTQSVNSLFLRGALEQDKCWSLINDYRKLEKPESRRII